MTINNIIFNYFNKKSDQHKRKIGKFWATDVYKIKSGQLTVENFFDQPEVSWSDIGNIFTGLAYERELMYILNQTDTPHKSHRKKSIVISRGIVIVSNLDIMFPGAIAEIKAPTKLKTEIPEWYKDQAEIYHRAWKKDVYFYFFVPRSLTGVYNKLIIEKKYKPSDVRWNNIKTLLIDFNKQLKLYYDQKD